jgi:hypothetical protein
MAAIIHSYLVQVAAAELAYQEMLHDHLLYGEHFRGREGRVDPTRVWTLDNGRTWVYAPTGEQVTHFPKGGMP